MCKGVSQESRKWFREFASERFWDKYGDWNQNWTQTEEEVDRNGELGTGNQLQTLKKTSNSWLCFTL